MTQSEYSKEHGQDPAVLVSSLRDVSVAAHHALKMERNEATTAILAARIEEIERGFRNLGLKDLACFANSLKMRLISRD